MKFGTYEKDDEEKSEMSEMHGEKEGPSLSDMAGRKAASKVLAALEAGDPGMLDKALRAHYAACE